MIQQKIELHTHPFFDSYTIDDVFDAMDKRDIQILGLENLNQHIFPDIQKRAEKTKYRFNGSDNYAISVSKGDKDLYLLRSIELATSDNFHLIIIGSDRVKPNQEIMQTMNTALEDGALVIFDHPFVDNRNVRREISQQKEYKVIAICENYSGNLALEWNAYCKPITRKLIGGSDVNKKTDLFSKALKSNGYNIPLVADSDIHARNKRLLNAIGTSNIETNLNLSSGKTIISSLKENIFSGNYTNNKKYVSMPHFVEAFGVPYLFKHKFKNPRG